MSTITSTPVTTTSTTGTTNSTTSVDNQMIADNFTTFLTLLTTQLQNQNPLDPLDTNQFTQQLVMFAQVEQQMKSNDQLSTLISINQQAQQTSALAYVGATVVVDDSTAQLANGAATWNFNVSSPATATITITDSTGQTAYSGSFTVNPGASSFTWDGKGTNGQQWPDGAYTMSVTAVDANKQPVAVTTTVQATVTSVDLTQNPPLLSINGKNYTVDQIQKIVAPSSTSATSAVSSAVTTATDAVTSAVNSTVSTVTSALQ